MDPLYYNSSLLPEIDNLSLYERTRVMQEIHWAISENMDRIEIELQSLRDGVKLVLQQYEYSELYDALNKRHR